MKDSMMGIWFNSTQEIAEELSKYLKGLQEQDWEDVFQDLENYLCERVAVDGQYLNETIFYKFLKIMNNSWMFLIT